MEPQTIVLQSAIRGGAAMASDALRLVNAKTVKIYCRNVNARGFSAGFVLASTLSLLIWILFGF